MSTQDPNPSGVGDQNVERLISKAYQPEQPDAALLPRVSAEMCNAAVAGGKLHAAGAHRDETYRLMPLFIGMAVSIAFVLVIFHAIYPPRQEPRFDRILHESTASVSKSVLPDAAPETEGMKARARPKAEPIQVAAVGEEINTGDQGRRVPLPDGTILYVKRNSVLRLDADRKLTLLKGEVFADVSPRPKDSGKTFVITAGQREVKALGTKFAVRTDQTGKTGVVVTQGAVQVTGYDQPIPAGQQLIEAGKDQGPTPAERISHVLDWTRELMAAADSPLVPDSKYTGGALVAVDPNGQEAKLTLRKYHVDVHIEDGFARTIIDQTYFNSANLRMEGTFYFPLPADASLSRLAMYVDGDLREGGMAERDYARNVYEEVMYSQKDPALLEWVDGSTFKMRVFPLEARQEKRIIIGYTQKLPALYGQTQYRFPAGHSLGMVNDWSLHVRVKNGKAFQVSSDSHELKQKADGSDLVFDAAQKNAKLDRDVTLNVIDTTGGAGHAFSTLQREGNRYVMLRYRPDLQVQKQRQNRDWVFLFETSGDRDPLLARVQIEVIRTLLANAEYLDKFTIVSAGTRTHTFSPEPVPVNPENIKAAIEFLESAHLIGALDLSKALTECQPILSQCQNPYLVHVGSGIAAMGERRPEVLAKQVPQRAHYVGVGVGKRWSRAFMKSAAEQSGGYFTQINPDEPVSWRAFDLAATLNTPRLMDVKVLADTPAARFLLHGNSIAQGEEICAVARFGKDEPLPAKLTIHGNLDGSAFQQEIALPQQMPETGHLPRTWARLEIERLLAEQANLATHEKQVETRKQIVELSKQMYVMSPYTSLLVLENDEMYQRFKVDRGRKDHWAMYATPVKIKVVYEPEVGEPVDARFAPKQAKPHANQVLQTILVRVSPSILTWPNRHQRYRGQQAVTALLVYRGAFAVPMNNGAPFGHDGEHAAPLPVDADLALTNAEDLGTSAAFDGLNKTIFAGERGEARIRSLMTITRPASVDALRFKDSVQGVYRGGAQFGNLGGQFGLTAGMSRRFLQNAPVSMNGQPAFARALESEQASFQYAIAPFGGFPAAAASPVPAAFTGRQFDSFGGVNGAPMGLLREHQRVNESLKEIGRALRDEKVVRSTSEKLMKQIVAGQNNGPIEYGRPSFSQDDRVFADLVAFAPGMNTSQADIEAILEAEAMPGLANLPGAIDPAARPLIEQARTAGWQTLTISGAPGSGLSVKVTFDGQGRYAYERTTPMGLREEVICDGKTILTLYPELGIGARRQVTRFHRAELTALVPWLVGPIEDLARGADVQKVGERTIAVLPRGAASQKDDDGKPVPYAATHLTFGADGRLAERRIVRVAFENNAPKTTTLLVETYAAAGDVQLKNAKGKELSKHQLKLAPAQQPELNRDTAKLVVLPLPWRQPDHVYNELGVDRGTLTTSGEAWTYQYLAPEKALALLAAEFSSSNPRQVRELHRRCFVANGRNQLGFYVLLTALDVPVAADPEFRKLLDAEPAQPLARYLALQGNPMYRTLQARYGLDVGTSVGQPTSLLQRLSSFRDLNLRWDFTWSNARSASERAQVFHQGLDYVRQNKSSVFGWAMLSQLQDRGNTEAFQRDIAAAWKQFVDRSDIGYIAQYEHARSLLRGGKVDEAAKAFRELYVQMIKAQVLPPIDGSFRYALLHADKGADDWTPLMQQTAEGLLKDKLRPSVVTLAWQCWRLGDAPLAENLLVAALKDPGDDAERLLVTVAAVDYLLGTGQDARADSLVTPLLDNETFAKKPTLWRLAALTAQRRGQTARSIQCLETALEQEFQNLPEVVNLQQVRHDYGQLLTHYDWLAGAVATLKITAPPDLAARTIRAADRWRALDRNNGDVCEQAARILKTLGARDMAWDYLTTPIGMHPGEAGPWQQLAQRLSHQGDLDLSDRAYQAAFDTEPTDAQMLWDRAQNLKRAGKSDEAKKVLRRIADSDWQPRFAWLKSQARWQLEGR